MWIGPMFDRLVLPNSSIAHGALQVMLLVLPELIFHPVILRCEKLLIERFMTSRLQSSHSVSMLL